MDTYFCLKDIGKVCFWSCLFVIFPHKRSKGRMQGDFFSPDWVKMEETEVQDQWGAHSGRLSYLWEPVVVSDYMNRKPPPRVQVCLPGHGIAFGKVQVRPVQLCHKANSLLESEVSRLGAFSPPSEPCILRQLDPLYLGASFAAL